MRIRRQLFFYNTISVVVALLAMLAVNSAATHVIGRRYQQRAEQVLQSIPDDRHPKGDFILMEREGESYEMLALSPPPGSEPFGRHRPQSEALMLSLLLSGSAAIVVIVLLNLLFTRYQTKKLLQPVEALVQACWRNRSGSRPTSRPVPSWWPASLTTCVPRSPV